MSIRKKLLIFFLVQHLVFLIMALILGSLVIRPHNLEMEKKYSQEKISQITNIFYSEMKHLNLISIDWAVWDDTYAYVQDRNDEYIQSNFTHDLLDDINLNHIEIFDISGKSIYRNNDGQLDMSALMQDSKTLRKEFLLADGKESNYGVLALADKFALITIGSILQGDRQNPSVGYLMMLRIVDKDMIENINKSTNSTISLINEKDLSLEDRFEKKDFFIEVVNHKNLLAYGSLKGLDQEVSTLIKAGLRRELIIESEKLILFLFIFASILGIVSLLVSLYLIRISITKPLKRLVGHIIKIREDGTYINSALAHREDEIGLMSKEFNLLLKKLHKTNKALLKVARIDALTGLANRLDMEEKFEKERKISIREGVEFTILLLDIDYFKKYNDSYGHVKGDEVLRLVAQEIQSSSLRPGDYFARYGGEEFIGILANTDKEGSVTIAKRILKRIESLNIEHQSSMLEKKIISVSIGCLSIRAKKGDTQEFLINMADEALYKAKQMGRDRYCIYQDSSPILKKENSLSSRLVSLQEKTLHV